MWLTAVYYDGRQARPHPVTLCVEGDKLLLQGRDIVRREELNGLKIPPPLGSTPRLILFADGGRCEVADRQGFAEMLQDAGNSAVAGMENSWWYALAALLLTLSLLAVVYLFGLPYAARVVADRVPVYLLERMDNQFFASLDQTLLMPSKLAEERRHTLQDGLRRLVLPPGEDRPAHIEFRGSPTLGANAFALPGGSVLVLDDLVNLASNDQEILAVLAHEMGHVHEKHALRQMLQASVVGLAMAWYIGDVSSLLAVAPTVLLETRYSRDFERRADAFAAELLRGNGIPVSRLADILEKLEAAHQTAAPKQLAESVEALDYLSSHPNTEERIKRLRGL
ncbi:M48 family metallopeptidase [Methylomonas rosea]|uniref:M48 family metallopeptidase n=1 Tax=Methylomonas rosea TaxID=2952227 RepID=A0ABT1TPC0_9GAMM|nr:M48 family metallopeptidase [Methylomonas sp. WSC-7]MCQ8116453.1 M48 family metallopeptidase [Methylomonas sp. WSC-7]